MTISIDYSVLTDWYNAREGIPSSASTDFAATAAATAPKSPTPPWSSSSTAIRSSALAKAVMSGARFVDPTAAKLDAPSGTQGSDYKNLFALYQGLNALEGLTEQAQAKGVGATALAAIQSRFTAGMAEVQGFLNGKPFSAFTLAQGAVGASESTKAGAKTESDTYQTSTVYAGDRNGEVPAFQGAVAFNLTVTRTGGVQFPVSFDLAEMGATPRTMSNVAAYLNDKLKAAGLLTRFSVVDTPATAQVVKTGTSSYTLPAGPDQFSLKIKGDSTEQLAFSASATTPAVYVANSSGASSPALSSVKLNGDPAAAAQPAVFSTPLGVGAAAARATAAAPDGSVYVLTDVTGAAADGQAIKGSRDVVLNKYDSAGNLVFARTLGAAASASGYALTVSADGASVAVAGSVTGALDQGATGASATTTDSFVSVFNAAGEEQWTQRRGAADADQATGVAFAADGSVYVSGTTASAMPGATAVGGATDGYLMGFSASGSATFTTQFGTASGDKTSGVAVSGSSVFVAGIEAGDAVVRRYDLQSGAAPTLAATRDLGPLQGGDVTGIKVAPDGSVVVAGSTHNGALSGGVVTQAYDGGRDAFVARLDASLQPGASDALTYLGGGQDRTVTGLDVSGGEVWLTGQVATTPLPGQTSAWNGYATALDASTGAVGWSRTLQGADFNDAPSSISVAPSATSVLDQLGLPTGAISYAPTKTLVGATALRAGDEFFVAGGGGAPKAVVIEAADTFETLATKIARASGFTAAVTTVTANGVRTLKITPANPSSQVSITAGPAGRDALAPLGLAEGRVETATTATPKVGQPTANGKSYALGLPTTLDLSTPSAIKAAQSTLINAALKVKTIYTDMVTAVCKPSTATSGTVPTYLTNEIANYQAALTRLTGSSS